MSFLGFPIIGDELYGGVKVMKYGIKRQALHSYRLSFNDPFTAKSQVFESKLPDDILQLITKCGLKY
jgi:23S rRNA-/tRNA-specific pseudouridylate synthase